VFALNPRASRFCRPRVVPGELKASPRERQQCKVLLRQGELGEQVRPAGLPRRSFELAGTTRGRQNRLCPGIQRTRACTVDGQSARYARSFAGPVAFRPEDSRVIVMRRSAIEYVESSIAQDVTPLPHGRHRPRLLEGQGRREEREQPFEGIVIRKTRATTRRPSLFARSPTAIGVERIFPLHSLAIRRLRSSRTANVNCAIAALLPPRRSGEGVPRPTPWTSWTW